MDGIDYRRVFEATDDPLLVCETADGQVVDSNERACELLAADSSSLRDRPLGDLVAPGSDLATPLEAFHARPSGTDCVAIEGTVEHAGRTPFTAEVRLNELSEAYVLVGIHPSVVGEVQ